MTRPVGVGVDTPEDILKIEAALSQEAVTSLPQLVQLLTHRLPSLYVGEMKTAIAAQRMDWLICGDDDEESFHERWNKEMEI